MSATVLHSEDTKHRWVDVVLQEQQKPWHRSRPEIDKLTIHFENGSLEKFQRLADAINEIFGENTKKENDNG